MASLAEQRNVYMTKLQSLIDAKNAEIAEKVNAYKAELDAEVNTKVNTLKSELEAEKVTPEISQLVTFVHQLDAMIEYDKNGIASATEESAEDAEVADENVNDEAKSTEQLDGTGFEAIAADLADTRARLNTANSNRSVGSGIVLPRR